MKQSVRLVVPEAPSPQAVSTTKARAFKKAGFRLGILDNSKGNADYLLNFLVDGIKAAIPVASVVFQRKASVSLPAPKEMLDKLALESDFVVSAMAD